MLVAIAYKWGQINNHNYLITSTTGNAVSKDVNPKIYEDAKNVWRNRGGKYGVTIWLVSEAGEAYKREVLTHFPSSCKEEIPYEFGGIVDPQFMEIIEDEISKCDAQYHVEMAAKNMAKESYWSGKKTGLRWAVALLKSHTQD